MVPPIVIGKSAEILAVIARRGPPAARSRDYPARRRSERVRKNLPKGFRETINWGMICYEIPLERYPDT